MAYQVKKSLVTIVTILIGLIIYGGYVLSKVNTSLTINQYGMYVLLAVPALMITQIVGKIIFDIFNRTQEKKEEPKKMDELDRIIEYKSVRNFSFMFLAGFFTSMLLMWILGTLFAAFMVMFLTLFASGIVLQISYIVYYNRGV